MYVIISHLFINNMFIFFSTDESLEFQTPRKQGAGKVTVTIRWAKVFEVPIDQRLDFTRPFTFTYKPDPRDIEPKAIRAFERYIILFVFKKV